MEYREQIVALVQTGQTIGSMPTEFGLADQTVRDWLKEAQDKPRRTAEHERRYDVS